jgi:hypothetical protein
MITNDQFNIKAKTLNNTARISGTPNDPIFGKFNGRYSSHDHSKEVIERISSDEWLDLIKGTELTKLYLGNYK